MDYFNRQILKLAVPNIISNICIPMLGVIDVVLLSSLDSEVYLGGIALGAIIFNYLFWGFSFLRMGTSGFVAQAFGSRNFNEIFGILLRSLAVAAIGGVLLIFLQIPIKALSFILLDGTERVESIAASYYSIRIWAAPATLIIYSFSGWFIGMQNARIPMFIGISVNLIAMLLDFFLIREMGLKSDAVAWGNVIAQWFGLGLCFFFYFKFYHSHFIKFKIKFSFFSVAKMRSFFRVNIDVFIRTICLISVFSFFTNKSAKSGDLILAVNYTLLQLFYVFSYGIDGFAYAAEALTGKLKGANRMFDLRKTVRLIFYWGIGIMFFFSITYIFFFDALIRFFNSRPDVFLIANHFYLWVVAIPLVTFAAFVWDGVFAGLIATKYMRNVMLVSVLVFFIPYLFNLECIIGDHVIWFSFLLFMITRSIGMSWMARRVLK